MSYFHREGSRYINTSLLLSIGSFILFIYFGHTWILIPFFIFLVVLIFSLQFFRYPNRPLPDLKSGEIISPADGKLVVNEILDDGRRQLSIFMSPLNVHANWVPVAGNVSRSEYIPGSYLVAWHPKSSTENERHETDIQLTNQDSITIKQIAGAVARRVRCYMTAGQQVQPGDELGFIKFGSRVDILLPGDSEVYVSLDQKVSGNKTILARLPSI